MVWPYLLNYSPHDATYVDFFRDSFSHSLFKRLTFIESKYIIGDLLTAFENFYPFTQIEIPLLEVTIPSDESSTSQISSCSVSTSQIGSSSASTSQMTNPDIGSTSDVSGSDSPAHRLNENQRSAIKLAVMMSIFLASGVLMGYTTKIDKSIGILIESIDGVYRELVSLEYDAISPEYQPVSTFEFDSHQQLVLSGFYTLSPFVIRFLNAEGVYKFRKNTELLLFSIGNDPYGDIDSQAFMVSSAANLGGVTKAFEELVVNEIFDKAFIKMFPGLFYSRYLGEVIIYSTALDEITFNESAGYALLKELRLTGEIVSIGPGDTPLMFYMDLCKLYITREGQVLTSRF
nr:hypothetical protein [Tanacetum cinerariifolium]